MTVDIELLERRAGMSIATLTPADVDRLRFSVWSRSSNESVRETIASYPGRSVWIPETLEYAIVGAWRHRPEIANIQELSAVRHPSELLSIIVERAARMGAALVLSVEVDERRPPAFYERAGFSRLEEVMTYELEPGWRRYAPSTRLAFDPVDPRRPDHLARLLELDHRSFPWLWWNSEQEFLAYAASPGVELFVGLDNGKPVSYLGITSYLGWGHLDRIAVLPEAQGDGFGREALDFAIARLSQHGARRIGLSTQRQNLRSRRLYERAGFRHVEVNDYLLHGRILRLPAGVDSATELI